MATLTNRKVSQTYKDLLQVSNSNSGIDSTLRGVEDGEGTSSILQLSTAAVNITGAGTLQYAGTAITSTAAELNILDGATVTVAELNVLDGYTGSVTELNYLDTLHATGVTATEFDYLDGVTSNIQTQLDSKISAVRTVTAGGNTLGASETLAFTAGSNVTITESGGAVTIASTDTNTQLSNAEVRTAVEAASDSNVFTDDDHTKLNGIESSADVTDATNVTAAGALMDSEVSNLSFVKGLTSGISNGNVLVANAAVSDNDFLKIDGTSVEGRTAAEMRSDLNVEDGADVTDTANVTSAGALMDSEIDADLKTFALPANTTISTFGKSIVDDADAAAVRTTIGVDAAGTDNSTDVSLSGSLDYITISGQTITRNAVDLAADVTGTLPVANGGTGATSLNNLITLSTHTTGNYVAGISGTSNEIEVSGSGSEGATVTIGLPDDVTIAGDLTVNGDTVTVSTATLSVEDPLIKLAKGNNSADSVDIGFYGLYDTSGSQDLYAGLFRDANDSGKFKLFKDLQAEPTTTVNTGGTGYAVATLVSNLEGNVTGNASTATALQNGRDFSYTGDVTGTTASQFDGTGDISIALTIASTAVESGMLNNNVISGQTNMTGDVADADELMISDAGTLKRIDFSVFRDAIFNDISGDATVASGGALTIAADSVALGTDTTGNYVATVADSGTGGITVANSGSESAAVTVELDINGLTAATLASGDFLAFSDESATGDPTKKESIDDIATLFAGAGLTASSAVINLDITGFDAIAEGALTEASDVMLVYDASAGVNKKITIEDLEDAIGGTGTVTNVVAGTGLSGGGTTTATLDLDFSELTDMTGDISGSTEFILQNSTTESRKAASEIKLSNFNNDSGFVTANTMGSGFVLEDGDGTEVTITENKEVKFIDGTGMQINWTDVDNGTDADPYDLTFELDVDGLTLLNEAPADADTFILYDDSASSIKKVPASEVGSDTTYSAGSGLDLSSTTFSVDVSDFMSNGANNYIVTATGTDAMNAEANLTFDGTSLKLPGDNLKIEIGASDDLEIYHDGTNTVLNNTTGELQFYNQDTDKDISFIVDDGGGNNITALKIDASEVGKVRLPNDGQTLSLGAGNDLTFQHDGSNSYIGNGVGNLYISNDTDDGDIIFRTDDGSGGVTEYFKLAGDATIITTSVNNRFDDSKKILMGGGSDLHMYHDGTHSYLYNYTGDFKITSFADDKDIIFSSDDGSGGTTAYITLDGSVGRLEAHKDIKFADSVDIHMGTHLDLKLYHDGSNSYIDQNGTGDLIIQQQTNDKDIILKSDDGSGGVTPYLTIDGSAERTVFDKHIRVNDNVEVQIGSAGDMPIYHNGTNSLIDNYTGSLIIQTRADDEDIILKSDDGSGGVTAYLTLDGSATRTNVSKDLRLDDSVNLQLGSGGDCGFSHDGSNTQISNATGNLTIQVSADDGDLIFKSDDGSGGVATYLTLDGSATTIRAYQHFNISGVGKALRFDTTGSTESNIIQTINDYETVIATNRGSAGFGVIGNSDIRFGFGTSYNAAQTKLYINGSSGNVGIGTTSPSVKLQVADTSTHCFIRVKGGTGNYAGIDFGDDDDDDISRIRHNNSDNSLGFWTNNTEAVRIDSSQDAHFDQDVIAFSTTPSDIRLKKNFTKIENGLDVVNKLEGHTFNWKKGGDRLSAGFKAQEVEKILPHLVDEKKLPLKADDDKEYKILRYEEMIPYLVEAIKEQQKQIDKLEEKLNG